MVSSPIARPSQVLARPQVRGGGREEQRGDGEAEQIEHVEAERGPPQCSCHAGLRRGLDRGRRGLGDRTLQGPGAGTLAGCTIAASHAARDHTGPQAASRYEPHSQASAGNQLPVSWLHQWHWPPSVWPQVEQSTQW